MKKLSAREHAEITVAGSPDPAPWKVAFAAFVGDFILRPCEFSEDSLELACRLELMAAQLREQHLGLCELFPEPGVAYRPVDPFKAMATTAEGN